MTGRPAATSGARRQETAGAAFRIEHTKRRFAPLTCGPPPRKSSTT